MALYNGSTWVINPFSELSLSFSGLSASTNYDIFLYNNSGVLTLEATAWSSDTARATALVAQDGVYVKSGATQHRYLGTVRMTSTAGQAEDSANNRFLWNYYNRVQRVLVAQSTTASWAPTTTNWRAAMGAGSVVGTNQVNLVLGVVEDPVVAVVQAQAILNSSDYACVGMGLDSTTAPSDQLRANNGSAGINTATVSQLAAYYTGYPSIGKHSLNWIESVTGAATFYGDNATVSYCQSGLVAVLLG